MAGQSACQMIAGCLERFRSDFRTRYPEPGERPPSRPDKLVMAAVPERPIEVRLRKLPPEIGILLIVVGTAGLLLPGPVGSPFLVAGESRLAGRIPQGGALVHEGRPGMYETGTQQIEHFLADLKRRYPGALR